MILCSTQCMITCTLQCVAESLLRPGDISVGTGTVVKSIISAILFIQCCSKDPNMLS